MKRLLLISLVCSIAGFGGTLTIPTQTGVTYVPAPGAYSYPTDAVVRVSVSVPASKLATVYAGTEAIEPEGGLYPIPVPQASAVTINTVLEKKPPEPFPAKDGILSVKFNASPSWRKVVFGSPKDIKFVDDGSSYLYPSVSDSAMAVAEGGIIYVANSTNDTITVSTKGDDAVIHCSPVKLSSGSCLVLGTKTSELWFKGAGNLIIMGATK